MYVVIKKIQYANVQLKKLHNKGSYLHYYEHIIHHNYISIIPFHSASQPPKPQCPCSLSTDALYLELRILLPKNSLDYINHSQSFQIRRPCHRTSYLRVRCTSCSTALPPNRPQVYTPSCTVSLPSIHDPRLRVILTVYCAVAQQIN